MSSRPEAAPDAELTPPVPIPSSSNPEPTLRHLFGRIDQELRSRLNARLERFDLTGPGYTMLFVLRRLPGLSNAELARRAGLTPQATILTLQLLVSRGFVERRPSASHGRKLDNFLTPTGERVIRQCEAEATELEEAMLRGLGGHARSELDALLRTCAANLGALN